MPEQDATIQDDPWLIKFFKDFETMPATSNADVNWPLTLEYQVFTEYLVKDIRDIQSQLKSADDQYLYYVCRHIFNILDWMKLMVVDADNLPFVSAIEDLFNETFGDKHILQNIYDDCLEQWIGQKSGQQQVGANFYNIVEGKLYYHNRFEQWFEVNKQTAFDLKPNQELVRDKNIIDQLNKEYGPTWYDAIIKRWDEKQYQGRLSDAFAQFEGEETSPDIYSDFTVEQIQTLLRNPVSITELERWNGGEIMDLEDLIKICTPILDMIQRIRKDGNHTLYLLRDCMMFYEIQKTVDILESESTSFDQVMVGRKLLSHESRKWAYYVGALEALYNAHLHYPTNFEQFYNDYARLIDKFITLNPGFAQVITTLAEYIKAHIQTDNENIVVFDVGYEGSIALLTKYIIDHHIFSPDAKDQKDTNIKLGVVALWSKKLFEGKFYDDYFAFLNRVQLSTRSNDLYQYKPGSFESGELRVLMGDKDKQHAAAVELVIVVMLTLLAQSDK